MMVQCCFITIFDLRACVRDVTCRVVPCRAEAEAEVQVRSGPVQARNYVLLISFLFLFRKKQERKHLLHLQNVDAARSSLLDILAFMAPSRHTFNGLSIKSKASTPFDEKKRGGNILDCF